MFGYKCTQIHTNRQTSPFLKQPPHFTQTNKNTFRHITNQIITSVPASTTFTDLTAPTAIHVTCGHVKTSATDSDKLLRFNPCHFKWGEKIQKLERNTRLGLLFSVSKGLQFWWRMRFTFWRLVERIYIFMLFETEGGGG